jgi:ferric-dicitrate binding protein FerR (iron transport regulator)
MSSPMPAHESADDAPKTGFKRFMPLLLVIVAASMMIGYASVGWNIMQSQPDFSETYKAEGTEQTIALPDGSSLQLQGVANVSYSAKVRKVILMSGKATLAVTNNPVEFYLIAGKARVIADGASFSVVNPRTSNTFEPVDVTAINGTVQVMRDSVWLWQTKTPVTRGQTVQVDAQGNVGEVVQTAE